MVSSTAGINWLEILLLLLGGSGIWGMPPGRQDTTLQKIAPQQTLLYVEWTGRVETRANDDTPTDGVFGTGFDGLVADPEINAFIDSVRKAIASAKTEVDEAGDDSTSEIVSKVKLLKVALPILEIATRHPGCLFVYYQPPDPNGNLLGFLNKANIAKQIRVGVVSSAGKEVETLLAELAKAGEIELGAKPDRQDVSFGPLGLKLSVHREDDRVIIGFGDGLIDRALSGLKGESPGVGENPKYLRAMKTVAVDRPAITSWIDLKGVVDAAVSAVGPAGVMVQTFSRALAIDAFEHAATATGLTKDGDVLQRTFLVTGGRSDGILVLTSGPAIQQKHLRHIPADSELVAAISVNFSQVVRAARTMIGRSTPGAAAVFDEAIKELEAELQLSFEKDVYPAVGDVWSVFSSPGDGSVAGTSTILAIEVRNPENASAVFERLMKLLAQSVSFEVDPDYEGQTVELRKQDFLGTSIHYFNTVGWGLGIESAASPAFCLTKEHVLFAPHPQALKAYLRHRRDDKRSTQLHPLVSRLEGEVLAFGWLDGQEAGRIFSSLLPYFGQSVLGHFQSEGIPLDVFSLPSAASIRPYCGNSQVVLVRQNDGLLMESRNPHVGLFVAGLMVAMKKWYLPDYGDELFDVPNAARSRKRPVELGKAAGDVVPAAAEEVAKESKKKGEVIQKDGMGAVAARKIGPLILKAMIPDEIQQLVPEDVFKKLEEPPSEETLQRREDRRKMNEERRKQRLDRRRPSIAP